MSRARLVAAAQGEAPFDRLLTGGTIADVATGELRAADIGILDGLIASLHPPGSRQDAAAIDDMTGLVLAPGFIDSHLHYESSLMAPADYASVVAPAGTTTGVWDPHELANVAGLAGVAWARDAARGVPFRTLIAAPSCVPSAPGLEVAGAEIGPAEMAEMLGWEGVCGIAEVMDMAGVLAASPRMAGIVAAGMAAGRNINGHARGLSGAGLQAYVAAGVTSDHEITSAEDALQKLRAGLTVELRGSHDTLLPEVVAAIMALPVFPVTLVLCTDDVFPDELVAKGGLRDTVARVIARGMPPMLAIRCATLHAALRLKRDDIGLLAPGRAADIVALSDLATVAVARCYVAGQPAATQAPRPPPGLRQSMHLAPLAADALALRPRGVPSGRVRLPVVAGARFTTWGEAEAEVCDGIAAPPPGHSLLASVHRHGRADAVPRVALISGWGEIAGAVATTIAHDSHNLLVFGRDPALMAGAANALIAAGGGMAVMEPDGRLTLLPLPIAGLLAETPAAETARAFADLRAAADRVIAWQPPYAVFRGLTGVSLACNPGPHLTDRGIADIARGGVTDPAEPLGWPLKAQRDNNCA
ncbi:adenine deaminase [Humitalea rosea]|uniref:Adenine deaminase n=1 Tax=Humitalea rosea TaxID=990373 RepID=A0A2W7IF80_9PROT|nr:adenine deaminase C-terminal domain-containing protein [Humitalea rosea]PZW44738.1 adenine deaminase [Humitalea rosea]